MEAGEFAHEILTVDDGVGVQVWTMHQAPVNAINQALLSALEGALDRALADESVAAVVLASGLKVFSAGADATWMAKTVQESGSLALLEEFNRTMDRFRALCQRLRAAPFLVIAALDGHVLAGGLELAAACDLRFCTDNERVKVGVPEMDLFGCLPSGGGGAQYLVRILGASPALHFILDAKPVDPQRALGMGLVDRLCATATARVEAESFATAAAAKAGRIGISCAKRAVYLGGEIPLASGLEFDRSVHWDTMRRGNFLAGVDAFTTRFASEASTS